MKNNTLEIYKHNKRKKKQLKNIRKMLMDEHDYYVVNDSDQVDQSIADGHHLVDLDDPYGHREKSKAPAYKTEYSVIHENIQIPGVSGTEKKQFGTFAVPAD